MREIYKALVVGSVPTVVVAGVLYGQDAGAAGRGTATQPSTQPATRPGVRLATQPATQPRPAPVFRGGGGGAGRRG